MHQVFIHTYIYIYTYTVYIGKCYIFQLSFLFLQVLMIKVVCGVPCHASCHDRPPGHMGGPLTNAGTHPRPDYSRLSAAYRYLHSDGCSTRGHDSAHQTGRCS